MAFDGTLKFDTKIDESGFEAGLSKIGSIAKQGMAAVESESLKAGNAVASLGKRAVDINAVSDAASKAAAAMSDLGETAAAVEDIADAAADAEKAVEDLGEEASELDDLAEFAEDAAESVADIAEHTDDIDDLSDAAADAADAVSDIGEEAAHVDDVAEAAEDAADAVSEIGQSADDVEAVTHAAADAADSMSNLEGQAVSTSDPVESHFRKLGDIAKKGLSVVVKAVTAAAGAVSAIGLAAINAGEQFETSFAQLKTIMDTGAVSTENISDALRDLSDEMGVSAAELAETAYNAISATGDTAGAIDIAANASKLAVAGFTDSASALSTLTTVMNAYGMTADETAQISDSLIAVQNLGVTTVSQLSASMGKAIASASAYGVDLYNLESAYVNMTKAGINTAESTTYISSMLKELGDSGSAVSGILQAQTGKSFAELMQEGKTLGDILGILSDSVDGNATALMNLWGSAEAGKASNAILSQGLSQFTTKI